MLLLQLEVPPEAVEASVRLARAAGARVVLDPASPQVLAEELLREVNLIRPNAAEAKVLTGVRVTDRDSGRHAAEILMRRGVGAAVIGAPGGSLLLGRDGEHGVEHLPVRAVDATGAGDTFAAALAISIAREVDLPEAVRFANAAAALATTTLGAQGGLPPRKLVERLLH